MELATRAGGDGLGGAAAAAAAAPGVDPLLFGFRREAGAVTVWINAPPALYDDICNPIGLGNEWTVDEVGRVSDALVGLTLPFSAADLSQTLRALDRAVFNSPAALTPTFDLVVGADVAGAREQWVCHVWWRE